jgi:GT2 family glycosyltransferase
MSNMVDIIIPGWDNFELTRRCLDSIRVKQPGVGYRLIYVDGGSARAGVEALVRDYPDVTMVLLTENRGFCRAMNCGLGVALFGKAEFVLWLNNDVAVPTGDDGWLRRWGMHFDDPRVGAVGAVTDRVFGFQRRAEGMGVSVFKTVPVLIGFALMVRKSAFKQIGFLDERFDPGNYEDFDYSVRLRRAGYTLRVAESVWLHHQMHATMERLDGPQVIGSLLTTNRQKFVEKWGAERLAEMGINV